jgi:hypothetical protein
MRSSILVVLKARVTAPGQPLRLSTQLSRTEKILCGSTKLPCSSVAPMRSASPSVQRPAWQPLATTASPRARMCGSMGSGLMPGKSGSGCRESARGDADAGEDVGDECAAGAVHGVDAELHAGFGDEVEVGEALDGLEIGGRKSTSVMGAGCAARGDGLAEIRLDGGDDGGLARAAVPALVLDAVPLRGIVRRGDHDAAGGAALAHAEAQRRGGRDVVGELTGCRWLRRPQRRRGQRLWSRSACRSRCRGPWRGLPWRAGCRRRWPRRRCARWQR